MGAEGIKNELQEGFVIIDNNHLLRDTIEFLENGFNWGTLQTNKLFDHLCKQSRDMPSAAIYVVNGKIVIAALFFHQGYHADENKFVINFSNLFVAESCRGIETIRFVRNVSKALQNYIITCYTAKEIVSEILHLNKFENMMVQKFKIGFRHQKPFLSFRLPKSMCAFSLAFLKPTCIEEVTDLNKPPSITYKIHQVKKLGLRCNVMALICEGNQKINFYWTLYMILRYRIFRINIYKKVDSNESHNVWVIRNSSKNKYISPVRSEYMT
jgi:hypothetical protein